VPTTTPTVAVIGAGVSGLTAAYVLRNSHAVTLFEADNRLGGHAHTHDVRTSDGQELAIDSGFIVHNERTYPHLLRLFRELDVPTQPTEMSMSVTCAECGLSYAGSRGPAGLFAQRRRALDPRYLRMLTEVPRFHRRARAVLAGDAPTDLTWGEFLDQGGFSTYFVRHFAVPLVACVWSSGDQDARSLPGPAPVPVPRQPRDADRRRFADLAHGHRRLPDLRRAGRCHARRRARWERGGGSAAAR